MPVTLRNFVALVLTRFAFLPGERALPCTNGLLVIELMTVLRKTCEAGEAQYTASMTHLPENTGDAGMDVILVERKGEAASQRTRR